MAYTLYIRILYIHVYGAFVYSVYSHHVYCILHKSYLYTLYRCVCRLLDSGVTIQNIQATPHTLVYTHTIYIVYSIWLYLYSTTHYMYTIHIYCIHIIQCTVHPLYPGHIYMAIQYFLFFCILIWHIHYTYASCISKYTVLMYTLYMVSMCTLYYTYVMCVLCMCVCVGY